MRFGAAVHAVRGCVALTLLSAMQALNPDAEVAYRVAQAARSAANHADYATAATHLQAAVELVSNDSSSRWHVLAALHAATVVAAPRSSLECAAHRDLETAAMQAAGSQHGHRLFGWSQRRMGASNHRGEVLTVHIE